MNASFEENYMSLSNTEKSELIFQELKNSYCFWSIKKAIKEEIVRGKNRPNMDMSELIPKLLHELNLETRIKNKV
jgi:ABC-type dipeptide/oligopeptide/nickel transport system ATPase subunit